MTSTEDLQPPAAGSRDPEQIQREIAETREQLGDTVGALAEKTDVKAQAKQKLESAKETASDKREEVLGAARRVSPDSVTSAASQAAAKARENPQALTAAAAFLAGFAAARLTRRG